jgi:hypothetical protein
MGFYHGGFWAEHDKPGALLLIARPRSIEAVASRALLERLHPLSKVEKVCPGKRSAFLDRFLWHLL